LVTNTIFIICHHIFYFNTCFSKNKSCHFLTIETAQFVFLAVWGIKDVTLVRGQDGKISDTQGKDFWSLTRLCRVGDQYKSFPRVSEIFPSCPLTGVWFFFSLISLSCIFSGVWYYFSLSIFVLFTFHRAFSRKIVFRWWS
jgi:hypothetical protein